MRRTLHYRHSVITVAPVKVVVTGAAGFIGSHLVDEMLGRGYTVTGVDRKWRSGPSGYRHLSIEMADEGQLVSLAGIFARADMVFHLAGKPGVRGRGRHIEALRVRDNIVATRNLLDLVPLSTPIVATSSSSVYGGSLRGAPSREDDPLRPRGGYARSKVAMELLCERRRAEGGSVAVLRPFTVAGERQRPDMAFSLWLDAVDRGEPITLFGSDERARDITDVRHVVEGIIRAGERRLNQTINLGTGVSHRLIDMARALLEVSGLDGEILRQPTSADEVDSTLADTSRCRRYLGFIPKTDLHALLERQVYSTESRSLVAAT